MIHFKNIQLRNFTSYERARLAYAGPGQLVLVEGVNHDSDAADSNMSGKSNIITEALLWCLYGAGTKEKGPDGAQLAGVRVEDVVRSTASACSVTVEFTKDGDPYTVTRSRKRAGGVTLELRQGDALIQEASVAATQRVLEGVLGGLSYDTFTQTVLFGQSGRRFTTAKDSERKRVLEELLGLDVYTAARERVGAARREAAAEVSALESEVVVLQARADTRAEMIQQVESDLKDLRHAEAAEQKEYGQAVSAYRARRKELESALLQAEETAAHFERDLRRARTAMKAFPTLKQIAEAEELEMGLVEALSRYAIQAEAAQRRLRKFEELEGGECYTCEQPVPDEHAARIRAEITAQLKEVEQQADEARANRALLKPVLVRRERDRASRAVERAEASVERAQHNVEVCSAALEAVEEPTARRKPYADLGRQLRERRKLAAAELKSALGAVEQADERLGRAMGRVEDLDFWFEGFGPGGIKALLLDNVIPQLNELANRYAGVLTAGEVEVELDTEALSGPTDRFDVRVRSSGGLGYHLCSGGLRRRVDFAVALALQALQAHRGARCSLYLCDEPFESLDESGVEGVVELLRTFARENGLAVYVVTHLTGLRDWFDRTVTVEKRGGVSRVVG